MLVKSAGSIVIVAAAAMNATAGTQCPDVDGDGAVNMIDLLEVLQNWGDCPIEGACPSDFDGSGVTDVMDLLAVVNGWGQCPGDPGTGQFNYSQALQASLLFYEAQRAGELPEDSRLSWRGDAFTNIANAPQVNGTWPVDLSHRLMDAGDTPTFVLPITSAMTMIAWSAVDYREGYDVAQQWGHLSSTLRWHADWCVEAHPEPDVFCGQIGQGAQSHAWWIPAEVFPSAYEPKIWWLTAEDPGSEPPAEAAAFLAAASMVFAQEDPAYAATLLQHARELHDFAFDHQGAYHETITDVTSFYRSWSLWQDELCWSALWLYRATGEAAYLDRARSIYDTHFLHGNKTWTHNWDDKSYGCMVLLSALTGEQMYRDEAEAWLDYWTVGGPDGRIDYTPGGLAWLDTWGSLRYAANTAYLAAAYADLVGDAPDGRYRSFAISQVDYILGDNPRQSSYMCGIGENPPQRPHHRTAHGSWNDQLQDPEPNRHVLWGALVGGPASPDDFDWADDRGDYIANEVACDYNAGITAALACMAQTHGGTPFPDAEFPPLEDAWGKEMFVEASIIEDADTFTRVRCLLNNRSAWPARFSDALSFKIWLNLSEVFDAGLTIDDVVVDASFTQGATVSPITLIDPATGLAMVEVDYTGISFGPGPGTSYRRECQIGIGLDASAPPSAWSRDNDPSLSALPFGQDAVIKTSTIAVYDDGSLVFGDEGVADCDGNGVDDADDIAGGAQDLDGNGVPDVCQSDCDGDGEPDAYEIQQGASDCNGNGVPDACDIANGMPDDDGDGVPDACQLDGLSWSMSINDQWAGGFTGELLINNYADTPIDNWHVSVHAAFEMDNVWNAVLVSQSQGVIELMHPSWTTTIPAGGSISIGFQATGTPTMPTQVLVNGAPADPE
ncbi:MAG: glycoside hydrolase family 9 protein [Phycisphaerales bacterium]|nr:glycoside hydrolase family 9 protein [Phycisphaerales bacterium]